MTKRDWPTILQDAQDRQVTAPQLARDIGVHRGAVHQACKRLGIELPRRAELVEPTIVESYVAVEGFEEWRPIPWTDGRYEASSEGRVRSSCGHKVLRPATSPKGYLQVGIWFRGKRQTQKVHRLVAWAFVPNPEGKPYVDHDDFDRVNNRPGNLKWMTHHENQEHSLQAGRFHSVISPRRAPKLTADDVTAIRARKGESVRLIAKDYPQVSESHVFNILKGKKRALG